MSKFEFGEWFQENKYNGFVKRKWVKLSWENFKLVAQYVAYKMTKKHSHSDFSFIYDQKFSHYLQYVKNSLYCIRNGKNV